MTLPDSTSINYGYDADGRRVLQTIGIQETNYLWDKTSPYGDVVIETDESDTVGYVLGGTELLSQNRDDTISYYLHDGQGSVRNLTDADGNVTDRYEYATFGKLLDHQGTTVNPYLYVGQQLDVMVGLYSLRARYYSPADGRFLSRDTADISMANPFEANRYVYVANNPINAFDPMGLQAMVEYSQQNSESETTELEANEAMTVEYPDFNPAPVESGHTTEVQKAITYGIRDAEKVWGEEVEVAFFERAEGAEIGEALGYPPKPAGAKTIQEGFWGLRKVTLPNGEVEVVVSDLDISYATRSGNILYDSEIHELIGTINGNYSREIVMHGSHLYGWAYDIPGAIEAKLYETAYLYGSEGFIRVITIAEFMSMP